VPTATPLSEFLPNDRVYFAEALNAGTLSLLSCHAESGFIIREEIREGDTREKWAEDF